MKNNWRKLKADRARKLKKIAANDNNEPNDSGPNNDNDGLSIVPLLLKGDCLALLATIPDNSVQLVLSDLPYGTTQCQWDTPIDLTALWKEIDRVLVKNGTAVMFASQPFTTVLAASNLKQLRYSLVWEKNRITGFLHAKNRVLKAHEDILVFSKGVAVHSHQSANRMVYNPQGVIALGTKKVKANRTSILYMRDGRTAHASGSEYEAGTNYPRSVLKFAKDEDHQHPTAKPVALLAYLIRTFSNDGDTVLDPTMGSGSALAAAYTTGRRSIGIELNDKFFAVAVARIEAALALPIAA